MTLLPAPAAAASYGKHLMNDKHGNSRRRENFGCLTAKQSFFDSASALRRHDDQVAPQILRDIDDYSGWITIGDMCGTHLKPHVSGRSLDHREYFLCKFRLIGVVRLYVRRPFTTTLRHNGKRFGDGDDRDFATKALCQGQAMIDAPLCEFRTVCRDENVSIHGETPDRLQLIC